MLTLDPQTTVVLLAIVVAFTGVAIVLLWRDNRSMKGLATLASCSGFGAIGIGLASVLPLLPLGLKLPIMNLIDMSLALAFVGLAVGVRRFYGVDTPSWVWRLAMLISLGGSFWWTWVDLDVSARGRLTTVILAASFLSAAWTVWRELEPTTRTGSRFLLVGLLGIGILAMPRLVEAHIMMSDSPLSVPLLIGSMISLLASLIGLFMVVSSRHLAVADALRGQAEAKDRTKSRFLAVMSHEIRTPMNGVLGLTDLMLRTELDDHQRHLARNIRSSGRILLRILDDVLDLSKIEAGRLEVEIITFRLRELIEDVLQLVEGPASSKGLELAHRIDPRASERLRGDPVRLGQVLLNLLGNAVKFTQQGTVSLQVEVLDDGRLAFDVADTGIGIAPDQQERLFGSFQQSDLSTARRFGGTGLGLSISKHLVRLMGGSLAVTSRLGEGSTFRVLLSLPSAAPEDGPETAEIPLRQAIFDEIYGVQEASNRGIHDFSNPMRASRRVLVAEDEPVNQLVVSGMLEGLGYACDVVDNGDLALQALEVTDYDLVLMDCQMPELDGFEATQRLRVSEARRASRRLPVVALTASALREEQQRCLEVGMDDVLTKPISAEELAAALAHWIEEI